MITPEAQQILIRDVLLGCGPEDAVIAWITSPWDTTEGFEQPTFRMEVWPNMDWNVVRMIPSHARIYARMGRQCMCVRGYVGHG